MSSAETVVVAGAGNLAQYLVEEFIADGKYHVAVISRSSRPSLDALGVEVQIVKEYSREAVLPILDSFKTRVLISTLHTDDPTAYTSLHEALLFACRDSKSCKRFIPSEFLGNTRDYAVPRGIYRARSAFRSVLFSQKDVTFTFVNPGWLADYFVQTPGSHKTYIRPFPQGWPIDLEKRTVRVIGTGDEPIGWTATRDMARAVVALIPHDDWPEYTWVYGELGTWNQAIQKVEKFYGIELQVFSGALPPPICSLH